MIKLVFYTDNLIPEQFAGITRWFIVLIRPKYKDDAGLLAHELVHVSQFWRSVGVLPILYRFSKKWRLVLEVEAYREQLKYYSDDRRTLFANFLATRYGLDITETEVLGLLQ